MKNFIIFDHDTGEILRHGSCPDDVFSAQARAGESVMEGEADDSIHYIVDTQLAARPAMPVTLDKTTVAEAEAATITGIPVDTVANVDGTLATVTDGTLSLTFDTTGSYLVTLKKFPYLDWEVTIRCS